MSKILRITFSLSFLLSAVVFAENTPKDQQTPLIALSPMLRKSLVASGTGGIDDRTESSLRTALARPDLSPSDRIAVFYTLLKLLELDFNGLQSLPPNLSYHDYVIAKGRAVSRARPIMNQRTDAVSQLQPWIIQNAGTDRIRASYGILLLELLDSPANVRVISQLDKDIPNSSYLIHAVALSSIISGEQSRTRILASLLDKVTIEEGIEDLIAALSFLSGEVAFKAVTRFTEKQENQKSNLAIETGLLAMQAHMKDADFARYLEQRRSTIPQINRMQSGSAEHAQDSYSTPVSVKLTYSLTRGAPMIKVWDDFDITLSDNGIYIEGEGGHDFVPR